VRPKTTISPVSLRGDTAENGKTGEMGVSTLIPVAVPLRPEGDPTEVVAEVGDILGGVAAVSPRSSIFGGGTGHHPWKNESVS
jgi:hypothetical protein